MNNEIKEILNYYRNIVNDKKETYTVVSRDTIYLEQLLDYITNLQEEYDNEVEENLKLSEWLVEKQQEKEDYKSRIEKAIRLIEEYHYFVFTKDIETIYKNANDEFINILRGKDK